MLSKAANLPLAESALMAPGAEFGGVEFYPDLATKAAVLCRRLAKNHALPDGNKRVAFVCLVEFLERNGAMLVIADDEGAADEVVEIMKAVAADQISEDAFAEWIAARVG